MCSVINVLTAKIPGRKVQLHIWLTWMAQFDIYNLNPVSNWFVWIVELAG